ncbi:chemotaxis protein CheX [Herminiimonas sp. CN]|uniref:chemotaxis protein CheX n=1 Tax=Herminiimonas sp. CN TaxID=1349818 RepID=UPI00047391BD|nr:chemotaxis protein CheX [Herminiimonas sp. CN]
MSLLTHEHLDALTEIFNVGAGRAASSLSEIVGDEVKLSVPSIEIIKSDEVDAKLLMQNDAKFGAVSQQFSGPFNADAVLLFSEENTLEIVRDMMGSQMSIEQLAEFEQEAMCELGNIILNACLSAIADMLGITMDSSLPSYAVESLHNILHRIADNSDQPYILLLHIDLAIEKRHTAGHLIFLLSSTSLSNLVAQIQRFIDGMR